MAWVWDTDGAKAVNLDAVAYVSVGGSGSSWYLTASDGGGILETPVYATKAEAVEALRNLVNAVDATDLV